MGVFNEILRSTEEELVKTFYVFRDEAPREQSERINLIAAKLQVKPQQLICALGFNPNIKQLNEVLHTIGLPNYEALANERNNIYANDIYRYLTLDNILNIYAVIKQDDETLQVMPYLIKERLKTIESRIEETVNSLIIDKYKAEMQAIYSDGIVGIDFAEERLNLHESGFRALLNEVTIITESKIIPIGDIFFRETILPEEKRKLLNKGLIPQDLIEARLEDDSASAQEKQILYDYLKLKK